MEPFENAAAKNARREKVGPPRVLIVDDEPDVTMALSAILERDGHETAIAAHGIAALEACQRFAPDVALLDIGLPDMDGYELARRIREGQQGHAVVLVAVTGHQRDATQLEAAGFDHHLIKPIDLRALRRLLASRPAT